METVYKWKCAICSGEVLRWKNIVEEFVIGVLYLLTMGDNNNSNAKTVQKMKLNFKELMRIVQFNEAKC